jgi:hypothetical protein
VCREALRLSLDHHRSLAVGLSGVQQRRGIADIFSQQKNRYDLVNMMQLDVVIGSGGVLSHAPHRLEAALMMIDGFALEGLTQITVDSIFMMPHLGVFASVHPGAAEEIFVKNCLVNIAHAVVPVWPGAVSLTSLARVLVEGQEVGLVRPGKVQLAQLPGQENQSVRLVLEPVHSSVDVGAGPGKVLERTITVGAYGLILDGRNRPLRLSSDPGVRVAEQCEILEALGIGSARKR